MSRARESRRRATFSGAGALLLLVLGAACSSDHASSNSSGGALNGSGGAAGASPQGGATNASGGAAPGGNSSGGADASAGSGTAAGTTGLGGDASQGGAAAQGGQRASGGASNGGASSGGASSGGSAGKGGNAGASAGGSGATLTPNPLISRGKGVESPQSDAAKAFDGDYAPGAGWTTPSASSGGVIQNAWVKINVGAGPKSLLLLWHHRDTPDYTIPPEINFGAPSDYVIEVSPTGADGSFTQVVSVVSTTTSPTYRSRAHRFDFSGMAYVRMSITRMRSTQPNKSRATLTEIDIHDASNGTDDTWAFVGGQAIRFAYDGHTKPLWPELIHEKHAGYYPALIDIADVNGKTDYLVENLAKWLTLNPDFHYWVLNYGLVESEGNAAPAQTKFRANLQAAIDALKAAGKVPVIPRFEKPTDKNHARAEEFNAIIDELVRSNGLPSAPDLWAWFASHPEHLCSTGCESADKIGAVPNDAGYDAINALWATTLDPLYTAR